MARSQYRASRYAGDKAAVQTIAVNVATATVVSIKLPEGFDRYLIFPMDVSAGAFGATDIVQWKLDNVASGSFTAIAPTAPASFSAVGEGARPMAQGQAVIVECPGGFQYLHLSHSNGATVSFWIECQHSAGHAE